MSFCFQFWMLLLLALNIILPKVLNINDAKGIQILYYDCSIILRLEGANHKYWLIQLGLFKIRQTQYCVLSDLNERISNYTYVLHPFTLPTSFSKTTPANWKSRLLRISLNETSAAMEKNWVITQNFNMRCLIYCTVVWKHVTSLFDLCFFVNKSVEENQSVNSPLNCLWFDSTDIFNKVTFVKVYEYYVFIEVILLKL